MARPGAHWDDVVLHFEWRQTALDNLLAVVTHRIEDSKATPTDVAILADSVCAWSKAQGKLDKDVAEWRKSS